MLREPLTAVDLPHSDTDFAARCEGWNLPARHATLYRAVINGMTGNIG